MDFKREIIYVCRHGQYMQCELSWRETLCVKDAGITLKIPTVSLPSRT